MVLVGVVVLTFGAGLSACDSGGGSKATPPTVPTTPTTVPHQLRDMSVNLVITGDSPATIQGTKGICQFPQTGQVAGYVVTSTDYPALGTDGYIRAFGPTLIDGQVAVPPNVKLFVGGEGYLTQVTGTGITVRDDGQRLEIDSELYGAPGGSIDGSLVDPTYTLHGHISGTIRCTGPPRSSAG